MRKLTVIALFVLTGCAATAQRYDTVYNRVPNGYYHKWYDTCACFLAGTRFNLVNLGDGPTEDTTFINTRASFVPQPTLISGGLLMVDMERTYHYWLNDYRKPEYLMLYQYDAKTNSLEFLDSARWDTVTPRILKLPVCADTAACGFEYTYIYETHFRHPVLVDSVFYLGGTHNSCVPLSPGTYSIYRYKPTDYKFIGRLVSDPSSTCHDGGFWWYASRFGWLDKSNMINPAHSKIVFGGFIPILDSSLLEVGTNDSTRGHATGGGRFLSMTHRTITAVADSGYRFLYWSDGITDNPRQVLLTRDTLFTACFAESDRVLARVESNDEAMGSATGGGLYWVGDTLVLNASPQPVHKFLYWNDSVRDNPRQVLLTHDTGFTALFAPYGRYRVEAVPNNVEYGRVEGGGEYLEGDTAEIRAIPWILYEFLQWDDGDTSNPRRVEVTRDTQFTAIFVTREMIGDPSAGAPVFDLQPNPATESVRLVLYGQQSEGCLLVLRDALGRDVLRHRLAQGEESVTLTVSHLPEGVYFATIITTQGSVTRKLVIRR